MQLEQLTAPPVEPVTLAEVWAHLNLSPTGSPATTPDDAKLERLIKVARSRVENYIGGYLVQRAMRLTVAGCPMAQRWFGRRGITEMDREFGAGVPAIIRLYGGPVTAIDQIRYYNVSDALTTLSTSVYRLIQDRPSYVELVDGQVWPETAVRSDAVRIDYTAGYAPTTSPYDYRVNIPEDIREAVLQTVQLHYDSLAPKDDEGLNGTIKAILNPHRLHRFT